MEVRQANLFIQDERGPDNFIVIKYAVIAVIFVNYTSAVEGKVHRSMAGE
jgi:hypothetical protein